MKKQKSFFVWFILFLVVFNLFQIIISLKKELFNPRQQWNDSYLVLLFIFFIVFSTLTFAIYMIYFFKLFNLTKDVIRWTNIAFGSTLILDFVRFIVGVSSYDSYWTRFYLIFGGMIFIFYSIVLIVLWIVFVNYLSHSRLMN
mgnify:CR=1 FL=1